MTIDTVAATEDVDVIVATPRGETIRRCYRFLAALRQLGADDHAAVLDLLHLELADQRT